MPWKPREESWCSVAYENDDWHVEVIEPFKICNKHYGRALSWRIHAKSKLYETIKEEYP